MTEMLDAAVAKLAALPPKEQDRIAHWLLQELPDEELWNRRFSETQDALSKLAVETRKERAGGTQPTFSLTNCEVACDATFLDRVS
jgi:hypothetical protein